MIVPTAFYVNLENTLISREFFHRLMSTGKESYFSAFTSMDPRIALIAPTKDWCMLHIANPKILDIIRKKNIVIMPTLFSHVLPDSFPESIELQYRISSKILKYLFENINWLGIVPENTVSSIIVETAREYWDGVVLSVGHNNLRNLQVGNYTLVNNFGDHIPLQVIANSPARSIYMEMYREVRSTRDAVNTMIGSDPNNSCLFDFERPWSNIVYYPHEGKSPARMDVWKKFHKELSSYDIMLWNSLSGKPTSSIHLDTADLTMWNNSESLWLIDIQRDTLMKYLGKGDYFELAALIATSSMPPRTLTRFMNDDRFPSSFNGKCGHVDLVGDIAKVQEVLFICKNIQQRRRVDYGSEFLPKGQRFYLELLHKSITWIENAIM